MKPLLLFSFFVLIILSVFITACDSGSFTTDYSDIDLSYPVQTTSQNELMIDIAAGKNRYFLTPIADYKIGAVVRGKKRYFFDKMSRIAPYDLALAWGMMAEPHYAKQISISQAKRRYRFQIKRNAAVSTDWVYLHSSNNHIIPAGYNVRKGLQSIRKGDKIYMEGQLVNVFASVSNKNLNWKSSLVRNDRGDGACEIIYVKKIRVGHRLYE